MGGNKKYNGYKAYQYLEPGIDYKEFKLAKEINRVEPYIVPLSKNEEERVQELLENRILISLHDHPVARPENMKKYIYDYKKAGRGFTAYEGLSNSHLDAVFDSLMGFPVINSKMGWKWNDVIHDLGMRLSDIAHQDFVFPCYRVDDIVKAHDSGRIALIFTIESSTPIQNEVDRIDILYGLGVRSIGICYSESNMLGSGKRESNDSGLTAFGYDCVKRMNKIGMLIDVSHAGDKTAIDTVQASEKPIIISHSGARSLNGLSRVFPDEVILEMAEKGGVIGINASPHSTWTFNNPVHSIDSYMEHIEYCIELVGIDYVGVGPDTHYGDHVSLHLAGAERNLREGLGHYTRARSVKVPEEVFKHVDYVKGLENPSDYTNVPRWLVKNGYSDPEITKIVGENCIRLLKNVW